VRDLKDIMYAVECRAARNVEQGGCSIQANLVAFMLQRVPLISRVNNTHKEPSCSRPIGNSALNQAGIVNGISRRHSTLVTDSRKSHWVMDAAHLRRTADALFMQRELGVKS